MISKELLEEVLNAKVDDFEVRSDRVVYDHYTDGYEEINIYELAHKCKEWGYSIYGYFISSFINGCCARAYIFTKEKVKIDKFYADTEPEAIFQAGQWIFDNK